MSLKNYSILSLALLVISALATYFWIEHDDAVLDGRRSMPVIVRTASPVAPRSALRSAQKVGQPSPEGNADAGTILRSGKVMSVMVDPADPVDLAAIRRSAIMDLEYCIASDLIYGAFWTQLKSPDEGRRWNNELLKSSEYQSIRMELSAELAKYPDYWATEDVETKNEIINLRKRFKVRMEPIVRPLIERALAENPAMKPPALYSVPGAATLYPGGAVNRTGDFGKSSGATVPPQPPPQQEKPKLFQ